MQQSSSGSTCRRIGLGRMKTPNASKSGPTVSLSFHKIDETPKKSKRDNQVHRCFSRGPYDSTRHDESPPPIIDSTGNDSTMSHFKLTKSITRPEEVLECDCDSTIHEQDAELPDVQPTHKDLSSIRRRVVLKEKQLQELRQAKVICIKHDPHELKEAIKMWLRGCQKALQELLLVLNNQDHQVKMEMLLQELGIPSILVQFNEDTQEFE